jgi:hypothetical protein
MKKLLAILLGLFLAGCTTITKKNGTAQSDLTLDANFFTLPVPSDERKSEYRFVVTITNTTKSEVIIPTRSFDGQPCCWTSGWGGEGVSYFVGEHSIGDYKIVPSPLRFFPVKLRPGETTEFARYHVKVDSHTPLQWFRASVTIDEEYGKKQGWWTGSLEVKIDLKDKNQINPFD